MATCERISEAFLIPVLEALLLSFPFMLIRFIAKPRRLREWPARGARMPQGARSASLARAPCSYRFAPRAPLLSRACRALTAPLVLGNQPDKHASPS